MNLLVTGGAGYIGSHTIYALQEQAPHYNITVIDNFSTGNLAALPKGCDFFHLDLQDKNQVENILKKRDIHAVLHFAASSRVEESMTHPLSYYENNLCGTRCLLEAMIDAGTKHLVFSSTAAVYGDAHTNLLTEESITCPKNPYGQTKLAMEQMIYWASKVHKLNYVSLRYFNAAGAHPSGDIGEAHSLKTHLIPRILQVASGEQEHISIFGDDYPTNDGTAVRDYIHVMDLAVAHILALDYLAKGGTSDVFNLGSGNGFSVAEVLETARQVTGQTIPTKMEARRMGDPAHLLASSQKANSALNWTAKNSDLSTIIADAWNWHKNRKF